MMIRTSSKPAARGLATGLSAGPKKGLLGRHEGLLKRDWANWTFDILFRRARNSRFIEFVSILCYILSMSKLNLFEVLPSCWR